MDKAVPLPTSPQSLPPLRVGTRGSKLALWQANRVISLLFGGDAASRAASAVVVEIKTSGDASQQSETPLRNISDPGVFTKELDAALLGGKIDFAVHSLKDLETNLRPELCIAAIIERGSVEDAFVVRDSLKGEILSVEDLRQGAVIGTSSVRRHSFLKRSCPGIAVGDIRGNIDTRLAKLNAEDGRYSAIILAAAGLERLGLGGCITKKLPPERFYPAVSQGAIAATCLRSSLGVRRVLAQANHGPTAATCTAERALLRRLGGGCKVPVGVCSELRARGSRAELSLKALLCSLDGAEALESEIEASLEPGPPGSKENLKTAAALGEALADELLRKGGERIIAGILNR